MQVVSISSWDQSFFEDFIHFRNEIHKDIENSFPEKISDFLNYFGEGSLFKDYSWVAIQVKKENLILAKAILTWKDDSTVGNVGFIDFTNNDEAAKLLQQEIEKRAIKRGLINLKGPVDLNFFIKYRLRLPGGGKAFYGEPMYPDYYQKMFMNLGYEIIGHWDTYKLDKFSNIRSFAKGRKKLEQSGGVVQGEVVVRPINISNWESELKIVYELFLKSFQEMPEYESISFEQFKFIYNDFKFLINPHLAYIVELDGKPVGFNINYVDPLSILKSAEDKNLNIIQKGILLARLKLNFSCLLIAYVGKIPGPNGEEIKGIQFKTSQRLWKWAIFMKKILVCYQSSDSPSRRTWKDNKLKPYAQYVLFGKKLDF